MQDIARSWRRLLCNEQPGCCNSKLQRPWTEAASTRAERVPGEARFGYGRLPKVRSSRDARYQLELRSANRYSTMHRRSDGFRLRSIGRGFDQGYLGPKPPDINRRDCIHTEDNEHDWKNRLFL